MKIEMAVGNKKELQTMEEIKNEMYWQRSRDFNYHHLTLEIKKNVKSISYTLNIKCIYTIEPIPTIWSNLPVILDQIRDEDFIVFYTS